MSKTYHVVRCARNSKFTTYEIYVDNIPYLVPAKGIVLGRREAYSIVKFLNGERK